MECLGSLSKGENNVSLTDWISKPGVLLNNWFVIALKKAKVKFTNSTAQ